MICTEKEQSSKGLEDQLLDYYVLESMADWVRVVNRDGIVTYANRKMKQELGEDILGKRCYEAFGQPVACENCITMQSITTGEIIQKEEKIGDRFFSVKSSPVRDSSDQVMAAVEVFRDVTRERLLEQELVKTNDKMKKDLVFAKKIQDRILPEKGIYGDLKMDYFYRPSEMLSGDIFDIFPVSGDIGFYIADVAGHGITASMMTMFILQVMRSIRYYSSSPEKSMIELTRRFKALGLDTDHYFTIFYAIYDRKTKRLRYSNAGHNCIPILYSESGVRYLELSGSPIMNLSEAFKPFLTFSERETEFYSGEKLVLYTDGVIENRHNQCDEIGLSGLVEMIQESKGNILPKIRELTSVGEKSAQDDDLAVITVERL